MIESGTIRLHYYINVFLLSHTFTLSWEVAIQDNMSVILKTAITLVTTGLKLCDNLYSFQSQLQEK